MITRPRLRGWMDRHKLKLTPEAISDLLGLVSGPDSRRQRICRHPGCRNQPCKVCFDHCTHREREVR